MEAMDVSLMSSVLGAEKRDLFRHSCAIRYGANLKNSQLGAGLPQNVPVRTGISLCAVASSLTLISS